MRVFIIKLQYKDKKDERDLSVFELRLSKQAKVRDSYSQIEVSHARILLYHFHTQLNVNPIWQQTSCLPRWLNRNVLSGEMGKWNTMVWCQHLIMRLVRNDTLWSAAPLLVWFLFLNLTFYNYNLQHIRTALSSNLPYDHGILQCDMTLLAMKMSSFKGLETIHLIFKSNFQQKLPRKKSRAQVGILVTIVMKNLRNWSNSCQL